MQDLILPKVNLVAPQRSLTGLSVEDFIVEKISANYNEIARLKEQYEKLTGRKFEEDSMPEPANNDFAFPSKREMILNVDKFLAEANGEPFKTRDIFNKYYPDITEKSIREEIVRRYSTELNDRRKKNKIYSKRVEGERGDVYSTNKEKLDSL